MKKFDEYTSKEKKLRISCYIFSVLMLCTCIVLSIVAYLNKGSEAAIRCLGPILHIVLIYIIELVLRYRVSNFVLVFYNIYVFFAALLGTGFDLYNLTYYDDVMHTIFGYVGGYIGLYLLVKFSEYEKMSTKFVMIMTFLTAMGCAAMWEVIEFYCDLFMKTTSQGKPINGIVPLKDTMYDIIVSFFGVCVFEIQYLVHRYKNKNLLIGSVVDDFIKN